MIPTAFDYERAVSIDDAVAKLSAANGNAKLIAGGHSLVPLMKLRLSEPQLLIDIARRIASPESQIAPPRWRAPKIDAHAVTQSAASARSRLCSRP